MRSGLNAHEDDAGWVESRGGLKKSGDIEPVEEARAEHVQVTPGHGHFDQPCLSALVMFGLIGIDCRQWLLRITPFVAQSCGIFY